MIKEILVIGANPEVVVLIQDAIGNKTNVSSTKEGTGTSTSSKKQFDLIFIDLATLGDEISDPLEKTIQHFRRHHQQTQFVVLTSK